MGFKVIGVPVIGMMTAVFAVVPAQPAWALPCETGQNKFVQRNVANPYSYGSMGTTYQGENVTIASCGLILHSVHLYFASPGQNLDYAEIGAAQFGSERGHFRIFRSWSLYPYTDTDYSASWWHTNQYMSFNVSNTVGTYPQWKFQYGLGEAPTTWTNYGGNTTAAALWYSNGIPLSEVERFGSTDGYIYAKNLKWRPSTGGWFPWEGMTCAHMYADLLYDWDAIRITGSSWHTVAQAPPAGDC